MKLTGSRGSSFLIKWASRLQGPQSTSLTESESIEWRRAAKAVLRVKGALDACRLKPVLCDSYVDNDALRMSVSRGSSAKLGHLRVHADTCFRFLAQLPISLHRVSTTENEADIMTKVLSGVRHRELCKTDFDLDGVPVASIMTHTALCHTAPCRHTGWKSLEEPDEVFSCSCATAQLLTKLTYVLKSEGCFCSRQVQKMFFESSSPNVRKGGARETWHHLLLRTVPRTVKYNVVKCPMRQRVNVKTRHPRVWESFVLRPPSGCEHELTDPLTSLRCVAPVLRCMFCAETKHVLLSVLGQRREGCFPFLPRLRRKFCIAVQADFLPGFLCWFPDPFFVIRATKSMF